MKRYLLLLIIIAASFFTGCATQQSKSAKPLKPVTGGPLDLRRFENITVLSFTDLSHNSDGILAGEQLANDVGERLQLDFPAVFTTTYVNKQQGQSNHVILTGTITTYRPGDAMARAMLIGTGSAGLEGTVIFRDGDNGQELMTAKFDKLWAWGGALGASKGITDMMSETAASIAVTAAKAKGWKPK
ncbi:MAG: hypothetical protein RLY20_3007 [Verrucomicrobiota bacterium]|jgi:hypothetical protein